MTSPLAMDGRDPQSITAESRGRKQYTAVEGEVKEDCSIFQD